VLTRIDREEKTKKNEDHAEGLCRYTNILSVSAHYKRARVSMCISSRIQLRVRLLWLPSRQTNDDRLTRRSFCFCHLA